MGLFGDSLGEKAEKACLAGDIEAWIKLRNKASKQGKKEYAKLLLHNDAAGFRHLCEIGHTQFVNWLIISASANGKDCLWRLITANDHEPMKLAAANGHPDVIKELAEAALMVDRQTY
jgi:hypothetical protein